MTVLLWCFPHEMGAALAYRAAHPDQTVMIRNVRNIGPGDIEPADRVLASTYCYGRVAKAYEGHGAHVEEVWLRPDYRHSVEPVDGGYALIEEGVRLGDVQATEEDAWAILDRKELGL